MKTPSSTSKTEELAAEFHGVYQAELQRQGKLSKYGDSYHELSEDIKNLDRALAKYVLALIHSKQVEVLEEFRELIGDAEDTSLKDLNPEEYNMELNQVHRQGRNELRIDLKKALAKLKKEL